MSTRKTTRRALIPFLASVGLLMAASPVARAKAGEPPPDPTRNADYFEGWDHGFESGRARAGDLHPESAVVAGALYDFMGYLTTRDDPITVGRSHEVYKLIEAFSAWSEERGLDVDGADVLSWTERLR